MQAKTMAWLWIVLALSATVAGASSTTGIPALQRITNHRVLSVVTVASPPRSEAVEPLMISPDGTQLAYQAYPPGPRPLPPGAPWGVAVQDIAGNNTKMLALPAGFDPLLQSWWPDGKHLVLVGGKEGATTTLFLASISDGTLEPLGPPGVQAMLDWPSLDGKTLVFVKQSGPAVYGYGSPGAPVLPKSKSMICRMAVDTKHLKTLAEGSAPRISPNGKRIVYKRSMDYEGVAKSDLWVMDLDGRHARRVLPWDRVYRRTWKNASLILSAFWLPDNRTIAVGIRRGGDSYDIWVVDDRGTIKQVISDAALQSVSLDGSKLLVSSPGLAPGGQAFVVGIGR